MCFFPKYFLKLCYLEKKKKKTPFWYKSDEIETLAATTTLSFAHELGFIHAILEGDSLVLINALKIEVHSLAPLGLLIKYVKVLSQNFDKLLYSHTKRNNNSCNLVWLNMLNAYQIF